MVEPFAAWIHHTRQRTLELASSLQPDALLGPRLPIVNPPLWELGHVAWFQERWILRGGGAALLVPGADALYDSTAVPHDARWSLPLPSLARTIEYLREAAERALAMVDRGDPDPSLVQLATHHEEMHLEAMWFTRQTLGYAAPAAARDSTDDGGDLPGDAVVPGGDFRIGAAPDGRFAFDNEQAAHSVPLSPFTIARAPVTQARFAAFVDDAGYRRRELWSEDGWRWREAIGAERPVYWRRAGRDGWLRRDFQRWVSLEPHRPMVNVSWFEAEAWCRWAQRRLPTEAEWEAAALGESDGGGRLGATPRLHPWGRAPISPERAHVDGRAFHAVDVGARPASDSAFGCRQMLGNVWEWTASDFQPYPGFAPGPYREYSEPWFGTHKVLRGGSFATPSRLARATFRNFYTPDRRDVWAGFRTCAP